MLIGMFSLFKNFFFPVSCCLCGELETLVCDRCIIDLERAHLKCLRCGKLNPLGNYCPHCSRPFLPIKAFATFRYDGFAKELVHKMKYEDLHEIAKPLARLLAVGLSKTFNLKGYKVSFVPADKRRKRYRGYNQAELLAREVASALQLECIDALDRIRLTESQIFSNSYVERRRNIRGSIIAKEKIEGNILLIDDVITSGATVEEAAKQLYRAGASNVVAVAVCMG